MKRIFSLIILAFLVWAAFTLNGVRVNAVNNVDFIPVSSGNYVTIYEQTGDTCTYTFRVVDLIEMGCNFDTGAAEYYNVTSDGNYLRIQCFRNSPLSGTAVANNIVAVKLSGVPSFPEGLWASIIVNYTLGYEGLEESIFNALGPDTQIGPYSNLICTYLGDQYSEIVLGFTPTYAAPTVELAGSLDYIFEEDVNVSLAALVKDSGTLETVSDANVTIQIYYPNGTLWISDKMVERLVGTGIYQWESNGTIHQMKLEKGVYLVHAKASIGNNKATSVILLFHIDPQRESETVPMALVQYCAISAIAVIAGAAAGITFLRRRRNSRIYHQ